MAIRIPIITDLADKGIREAEKAFGKLGKTGVLVGAAFSASAAAVTVAMTKSISAAAEDQRSQELLAKQLENTVGASDKTTKATEEFIGQMELASGVADDILRPALGNLVRATGDVTTAQDLLTLAQNISAGTGKDLESVSIALSKASLGQFTALSKLGIPLDENTKKTKDFGKVQESLDKQFGGASAAAAQTFSGQLERLGTVWDNLTESIGYAVLNNVYVRDAISLLPDAASKAVAAIGTKGLSGALGVFVDEMGITGAYAKRFGIAVALAYNNMAMHGYNAISLLTLGLAQLVPAFKKAGDEIAGNQMRLGLELQANEMYIGDLSKTMRDNEAQTKRNATETERWTQYTESLGLKSETTTGQLEGLGGGAAKADPKIKAMADRIKEAASALDKELNDALDKARTGLTDAQTAFSDFGDSVADGIKNAFSFKDAKTAGDETGTGFLAGLRNQVSGIVTYGTDVEALLKRGLSQDALQAVLAAGGESGAAIAHELVLGAQENITGPDGVNALVDTVNIVAQQIGLNAANQWYGAGVTSAKSYLQGVEDAFAAAQAKLGKKGIKLPDVKGIGAAFDAAISAPSVPVAPVMPAPFDYNDPFGMKNVVININGGIGTNAEQGEAVINAVRAYNRAAGPANILVA
jgi:hypothetical protein